MHTRPIRSSNLRRTNNQSRSRCKFMTHLVRILWSKWDYVKFYTRVPTCSLSAPPRTFNLRTRTSKSGLRRSNKSSRSRRLHSSGQSRISKVPIWKLPSRIWRTWRPIIKNSSVFITHLPRIGEIKISLRPLKLWSDRPTFVANDLFNAHTLFLQPSRSKCL